MWIHTQDAKSGFVDQTVIQKESLFSLKENVNNPFFSHIIQKLTMYQQSAKQNSVK